MPPRAADQVEVESAWAPLRTPLFRWLWIASVVSNTGTWMHDVGAAWLMTSLTPSPFMVALLQSALSLPVFLLGLPAGALADIVDRRRMLLFTQGWMLATAVALGLVTVAGLVTPGLLLALTFMLGLGVAMNMPAWQAITPEVVERRDLPAAVALGGISLNIARAVGPALGGLVVALWGPGVVFLLNAATFFCVIGVIARWRRAPTASSLPPEHVVGAIRAGMRYVRHAPALQAVLVRTAAFIVCASAVWALLPVVARQELELGAAGYGGLLACLGLGAVSGAALLPRVRAHLSTDRLLLIATLVFAGVGLSLAWLREIAGLAAIMAVAGVAWIAVLSSLNVAAQTVLPSWVRARGLAVYLIVFQGGMAVGAAIWGAFASWAGTPSALVVAAIGLVVGLAATARTRLAPGLRVDLTPSAHWPVPHVVLEPNADEGPVLVMVEYRIDSADAPGFVRAMKGLQQVRRRDGATRWGLYRDGNDPSRYLETFLVDSWTEHLRQHERVTESDRLFETSIRAFHRGDAPPRVSHFLTAAPRP